MKCRQPLFTSPVDSAQPTDPAGYSPPIPMPTFYDGQPQVPRTFQRLEFPSLYHPMLTKNLQAASIENMPTASP